MWKAVFEVIRRLFTINDDLNRLQAESKRHGEQILELAANQTRFQYELQLQKERAIHEREQARHQLELVLRDRVENELRLENQQLRERLDRLERSSLPSKPPDEPPRE